MAILSVHNYYLWVAFSGLLSCVVGSLNLLLVQVGSAPRLKLIEKTVLFSSFIFSIDVFSFVRCQLLRETESSVQTLRFQLT